MAAKVPLPQKKFELHYSDHDFIRSNIKRQMEFAMTTIRDSYQTILQQQQKKQNKFQQLKKKVTVFCRLIVATVF